MRAQSRLALACLPALAMTWASTTAAAQCAEWSPEFSSPGTDGVVHAKAFVQAGGSEQLLLGGDFAYVGATAVDKLALYDGTTWSAVAPGVPGDVLAVAQYDDGSGLKIYAGGNGFLSSWDGFAWNTMNVNGQVFALHVHDDGQGGALYAGGDFNSIAGTTLRDIGRYDGSWDDLSSGSSNSGWVLAFETHDDGSGPALYVGGRFDEMGGVPANRLARWDGTTFTEVGGGVDGQPGRRVRALRSFTPTGGPAELHVGGNFMGAGGSSTSNWVAWRQGAWADIGGAGQVETFALRETLAGPTICAARNAHVDCYDGISLSSLPLEVPSDSTVLAAYGANLPQELFVGTSQQNESWSWLSQWDGSRWSPVFEGPGQGLGLPSYPRALTTHDFGQGERLIAINSYGFFGAQQMLQYDGSSWETVDVPYFNYHIFGGALSFGGDLHVAGEIQLVGFSVKRLNGAVWEELGNPTARGGVRITGLATHDMGAGEELYVSYSGADDLDGPGTKGLARFDGTDWVSVGGGVTMGIPGAFNQSVTRMISWNDGTGPGLYAAGRFSEVGGVAANSIARWDGNSWSPLGSGVSSSTLGPNVYVSGLAVFDTPTGQQLIAIGGFDMAGGQPTNGIAAWDGNSWSPLGTGLTQQGAPANGGLVFAHDPDGFGDRIYVGGNFDEAGGVAAEDFAVWDGSSWSVPVVPPNSPLFGLVSDFASYDDGTGRALFIGGYFDNFAGVPAQGLAKFSDPCGAILGTPACTSNPNSTGEIGTTRARGVASVTADDLTVEARRLPANAFTLFFTGTGLQQGIAGDGVLCVAGSLRRMQPGGFADGNGVRTQAFDFQAPYAASAVAGQTLTIQGFFRDNAGGPAGFNTTDAVQILLQP